MMVSGFARYEGYSLPRFDGFERESRYLTASNGVRLAVDTYRPTRAGVHADRPLPVVLAMTPYNRAQVIDGRLVHPLSPLVVDGRVHLNVYLELNRHGYAIVFFDVRGQGASFGGLSGLYSAEEGRDAAEVIAWLRAQPWCDGKVGMLGSSYGGGTQFLTAAEAPLGLAALFACHSFFDVYDTLFPGGVRDLVVGREWAALLDGCGGRSQATQAAPVDGPDGPAQLAEAVEAHRRTQSAHEVCGAMQASPLRDGTGYFDRASDTGSQNLSTLLPRLRSAAVPCYHYGGFNDYFVAQQVLWFANWRGIAPTKLTIGPWTHYPNNCTSPRDDEDLRVRFTEALRWFDHWLKGVDNGILHDPPVHYAVQDSHRWRSGEFESEADRWQWRTSKHWPLDGIEMQRWHFAAGNSPSEDSLTEGRLQPGAAAHDAELRMHVDGAVGTGPTGRMAASFQLRPLCFPEMSATDARCLTFTTDALVHDMIVAGTPKVGLHATSTEDDAAVVVWLEDIDSAGRSTLISYGSLRASHRATGSAPYDTAGAPWHPGTAAVVASTTPLNAGVACIELCLLPLANRFLRGHRLRLTIAGADDGNLEPVCPGATLSVFSGPRWPSFVDLPVSIA